MMLTGRRPAARVPGVLQVMPGVSARVDGHRRLSRTQTNRHPAGPGHGHETGRHEQAQQHERQHQGEQPP